jgi:diguanylate cyclase (GGDEF)-like protein
MNEAGLSSRGAPEQLNALLELALSARDRPVDEILASVAETASAALGFGAVVINVYRPAWHDYQAVFVTGPEPIRQTLLGTTNSYSVIHEQLLIPRNERVPGAYLLTADADVWAELENTYYEPAEHAAQGDEWDARDGLLIPLRSTAGTPLGVISLDQPASNRRPSDAELRLLVAVCSHASLALETANARRLSELRELALERVLDFIARLRGVSSEAQILRETMTVAAEIGGFEAAAVYAREDEDLVPIASLGRSLELTAEAIDGVCFADGEDLVFIDAPTPSPRDGRGPRGWHSSVVLVRVRAAGSEDLGILVLADPEDHLLPDRVSCQQQLLLADQAGAALAVVHREHRLKLLAAHDPLTGLRNRRDLEASIDQLIGSGDGLAVLMLDLDHFKRINDDHGHDAGDQVLARFGRLLGQHARSTDFAIRLGGEEFCLLLPGADLSAASLVAERVRIEAPSAGGRELPMNLTVSCGIAIADAGQSARPLLHAADEALYAAKRSGRNRVCVAGRGGAGTPQIAASNRVHCR